MELKFDKDKITKLSSEIFAALERLKEISALPKGAFLADPYKIAAAKYFLVISTEAAIDMCNHVISRNRLRAPEDYADTFRIMGEVGAFEEDFVDRVSKMEDSGTGWCISIGKSMTRQYTVCLATMLTVCRNSPRGSWLFFPAGVSKQRNVVAAAADLETPQVRLFTIGIKRGFAPLKKSSSPSPS